ncbi:sodium-dependent bicarbonate transport family permease [Asticcacaulis sp. AND118]|uniref:sodium-dependent bicarbonate transport family permease n=1 Tax=Asticcacaulis sp. AND118 TaxID=2840468 RepID=UPI001CFF5DC9|nr:sodium-dependent bicarbonate transport family permease [Asticcacaulis sp. AND118]UDF05157.1 sodium-dependent bicarbonate transport family permease [Asticcacaulis sp. AND118]
MVQGMVSAPVLFFGLGLFAGLVRSNLSVPRSISQFLSIFLMMAIGLKGGMALRAEGAMTLEFAATLVVGVLFGLIQPVIGYALLKFTTSLDRPTAAATAAHYGSVSIVTFATAVSYLELNQVAFAGYIVAVVAMMEAPAIVSGLMLARGKSAQKRFSHLLAETATNGAVLLLIGSLLVGAVLGSETLTGVSALFIDPFQGVLCLFLLDMGLTVSRNLRHVRQFSLSLLAFGIYMPLIGALLGVIASRAIGLEDGTAFLFTVLCASASYIAVPAAMRVALPQAQQAIYIPMSLALTFPFNILIGIPLYFYMVGQ